MPPKKAAAASTKTTATHASYKDMIRDAIINLKERTGSSRQALKKYVRNNNSLNVASQSAFDVQFNRAVKAGVEKGEFLQPKGPSGPLKLAKKEATKPAAKAVAKKPAAAAAATSTATTAATAATAAATKPATKKTSTATKKKTTKAKSTSTSKKEGTKKSTDTKANVSKQRKTPVAAPAIVDVPQVIGKTKSGRITKTTAKSAPVTTPKKAGTPKKRATDKKKKTATPKKSEA
ncbi:hypothetical protein LOZ12_005838 [Ophidiomyces ophidiicola]|uniref:Uncharacterized protein n=1 Tax=Ophidiomyces ophidiicola TaxID=1387563 RepID=A0ACB8UNB0_9EURO|nr:hypothetical protein LOZ64_006349 [Ophidiomyces ophidiicola]KAI1933502.1 hypothetical protein LOZ62_006454 [Ophidiomyces ophidiicola]KAI2017099.1 hypothetical protein LOZ45_006388 [Ophidiomyces ophidiicola]KAI2042429.1 hypothetical protein LOZ44_006103 [Ophidiomyces ophidiicola]KAI2043938.1 hypothetical protein LOZ38_006528 [Ophidiomyces ophidiicola]